MNQYMRSIIFEKKIIDGLLSGQAGLPHPQAPNVKKARLYKELKEVVEATTTTTGQRADSSMSLGGRVKSPEMKALLDTSLQEG